MFHFFLLQYYPYYLDSDCEVWEENNLDVADEVDVLDLDEVDLAEPETSASSVLIMEEQKLKLLSHG